MILDSDLILASNYAPTATGTTNPAYTLDQGFAADWGMGMDWSLFVTVVTSFSTGSSPTLEIILQGNATDATFTAGTTYTIIDTGTVASATGTNPMIPANWQAGYQVKYKYPRGFIVRYLRLSVVVGTAAFTSGSFNAWLNTDNFQDNQTWAKANYTVL
jgi:hypothetical protein